MLPSLELPRGTHTRGTETAVPVALVPRAHRQTTGSAGNTPMSPPLSPNPQLSPLLVRR